MFGRATIANLQEFINNLEKETRVAWETEAKQRKIADGLRATLAEAVNQCRDIEKELEVARTEYDDKIDSLEYAINESKELNRILTDENQDLIRQLALLRAVLEQVRIHVHLPVGKPARKK